MIPSPLPLPLPLLRLQCLKLQRGTGTSLMTTLAAQCRSGRRWMWRDHSSGGEAMLRAHAQAVAHACMCLRVSTRFASDIFWFKKQRMPVTIARERPRALLKRWNRAHRVGCCGGNSSRLHGLGVGPAAPHSREVTAAADVCVCLCFKVHGISA